MYPSRKIGVSMSSNYVSLENARGLAAEGFPQDQFPQMVWCAYILKGPRGPDPEGGFWDCTYEEHNGRVTHSPEIPEWYAAPTHLQALEWLSRKGYQSVLYVKSDKFIGECFIQVGELLHGETPDALIAAIRTHMLDTESTNVV